MMLRPYLAVIHDSFRAAMKSRVLYIALALIVILLLVLAPLNVRQTLDWKLSYEASLPIPDRLVKRLVEEGSTGQRPAVAHIWNQLPDKLQDDLKQESSRDQNSNKPQPGMPGRPIHHRLVYQLNQLLEADSLYDKAAFERKRLGKEAKDLLEKGDSRTEIEDRRFNRLILSTALRRDIAFPGKTQLDTYYFNWHWPALTANVSHAEFASSITDKLPVFFDKFIMSIGIFIAILITAPIIPEMLEAGSLNLLLSKPIQRSGLLIAKYLGGCVFILLCSTLFFGGIYLWMWIQLGINERSILLSIPVYVIVFAMYYSVSVLAGIWFRSSILCITFTILFWMLCTAIGSTYSVLDYRHYNTAPVRMQAFENQLVTVDLSQKTQVWDQQQSNWRNASTREQSVEDTSFEIATYMDRMDELQGLLNLPSPTFDPENDRLLFADASIASAMSGSRLTLSAADVAKQWKTSSLGQLPAGTVGVFYSKRFGELAIDRTGAVFSRGRDDEKAVKTTEDKPKPKSKSLIAGLLTGTTSSNNYQRISDRQNLNPTSPTSVCFNQATDEVAVYSKGNVILLSPDATGKYTKRIEQQVGAHDNKRMTAFLACSESNIFVVLGNGYFSKLKFDTLEVVASHQLKHRSAVRNVSASPDGRFAVVTFRDGELWVHDGETNQERQTHSITGGDIMATTFDDQNRLWTGDRFQTATLHDLSAGGQVETRSPANNWITRGFRYGIRPLYRIFPKPGEFYKVVTQMASSTNTQTNPDVDLTKLPYRDNPWSPLTSGIVFLLVTLLISCLIFQRQDF